MADLELLDRGKARLAVRTGAYAIIALLLVAVLLHLLERAVGLPSSLEQGRHSWSYSATGFRAFHDVLVQLGYKVRRFQRTYASLPDPNASVLVTLDPGLLGGWTSETHRSIARESPDRIRKWLEQGGRLIATLPGRSLGSVAGVDILIDRSGPTFSQEMGSWPSAPIHEAVLSVLPELEPGALPGELRGYEELDSLRVEVPALGEELRRSLDPFLDPEPDRPIPLFARAGSSDVVLTLSEQPLAIRDRPGDGQSIAFASPLAFANAALLHTPLLEPLVRLVHEVSDGGQRWIHFDEHAHGFEDRGGALRWVADTALFFPVATLVILVLLCAWRGAVRAGPPRPERVPPRRTKEELVLSLADLHRRGRHLAHALEGVQAAYDARLAALLGVETLPAQGASPSPGGSPARRRTAPPADERALLREASRLHREYQQKKQSLSRSPERQKRTP